MTTYNNRPMTDLAEDDYWTLVDRLKEQIVPLIKQDVFKPFELKKTVRAVLNDEWSDGLTARQWLAQAGNRLGVDTSHCVGA